MRIKDGFIDVSKNLKRIKGNLDEVAKSNEEVKEATKNVQELCEKWLGLGVGK